MATNVLWTIAGTLVLLSGGADSRTWDRIVPRSTTLPRGAPPSSFDRRENTVSPVGVSSSLDVRPNKLHTNKFYTNFLLDGPSQSAWTLPYIVTVNDEYPFGLYVSYPKAFDGQVEEDGRLKWYATTTTKDVILTAKELYTNQETELTSFDEEGLSAVVTFTTEDSPAGSMTTYLSRGMAYATVSYTDFTPEVSTIHAILTVNGVAASSTNHTSDDGRFMVELNDGSTWILYFSEPEDLELAFIPPEPNRPNALMANFPMTGILQTTRVPYEPEDSKYDDAISLLDQYAGRYVTRGVIRAWKHNTRSARAKYTFSWTVSGSGSGLLHYALPHLQGKISSSQKTGIYLSSPTKGDMELITGTRWRIIDDTLPTMEWIPPASEITDPTQRQWIEWYLEKEIPETLDNFAGGSVYFGAKNLMAYAQLCLIAEELGRDDLIETCVDQVEGAVDQYISHSNGNPLVYDEIWGGVIGAQGLEEDNEAADFYASLYNDHHFHYSYLINAAAVLAKLRPSWATSTKQTWVNTLIRDVNDPNKYDSYFPQFRSFDWFCGHSWARGLLFSYDGKDQESTSEDVNFFYAMTMWGIAIENERLEQLGRLQLAMVQQSINEYFLLLDSNDNHPEDFVRNKVTGIFFESKVDYTTWFGDKVEYIHGIQNIPVTAITQYVRTPQFVSQEWEQRLEPIIDDVEGVWKTVLYMSYATLQKNMAFEEMLTSVVDDGLLRSWALYWAASRPECSTYCIHDEVDLPSVPVPTPAPVVPTGAWDGTPAVVPGTIEAEEYDYGGEGIGYSDTDRGNNGGAFRTDDVDISLIAEGEYNVGWNRAGEYLRYTVNVTTAVDVFDFEFVTAGPRGLAGEIQIVSDGTGCEDYSTDLSGVVSVPTTGSWTTFEAFTAPGVGGLPAGETTIWFCTVSPGFNIDSFTMTEGAAAA